ncbi:hypothetical protein AB0M44_48050 [Streptosporangium subroseum]|uniref:hypothetical protein n=1 Tax=Streptosporangium subroseum TaxID=106412 RepID=UPI00341BB44E
MISRVWCMALVLVLATLTACAGNDTSSSSSESSSTASSAGQGASGENSEKPAEDLCGDTAEKVKQSVTQPEVKKVSVTTGCSSVLVETALADDKSAAAQEICEAAAEVAYSADTNSVRVIGASGKELAVGISGAKCLAAS